jgi:DNA polymerase-1
MPDQTRVRPTTYCLIDGFAEIFRAYYAIRRPLHSPVTGEPTQAVLVFAQQLIKMLTTLKPDYVVVALDPFGKTFRDELYQQYTPVVESLPIELEPELVCSDGTVAPIGPESPAPEAEGTTEEVAPLPSYKGTRKETPDALTQQIPRILELLELFRIPVIECPGMEADDVIATLTERIVSTPDSEARQVYIITADKDLEQLIADGDQRRVLLYSIGSGTETDAKAVEEKRGITPAQIVDYLALTGDVVDNIPGVPGIGEKTAAKLLQRFGSLQGIQEHIEEVEPRWRENLQASLPTQLPISQKLITLQKNADVRFNMEEARVKEPLRDELDAFCETLGLVRLREQIRRVKTIPKDDPEP